MAIISDRYQQLYTLGGKIVDVSRFERNLSCNELGDKYGWEATMAWSNLIHDDLNSVGPGIREGDIYVDLGANIGMAALNAERRKAGKIYCVEPDVDCYEVLLRNKASNWIVDNVAISQSEGSIDVNQWPYANTRKVRCITFDQYVAQHNFDRIDFLKVDIEGHEKTVFNNVSNTSWDKIQRMAIEYHEDQTITEQQRTAERFNFAAKISENGFYYVTVLSRSFQSMIYAWK